MSYQNQKINKNPLLRGFPFFKKLLSQKKGKNMKTKLITGLICGILLSCASLEKSYAFQNRGFGTSSCQDYIKIYNNPEAEKEDLLFFEEDINGFINGYNSKTTEEGEETANSKIDKITNKEIAEDAYEICSEHKTLNFTTALIKALKEEDN